MYDESSSINVAILDCLGLAEYLKSLGVDGRIISTLKGILGDSLSFRYIF